jgi:hypothetical protein
MWLFTTCGFFSVVAHRDEPDTIVVRARLREDLEALRVHHLPDMEIVEGGGTDYAYRAFVSRDEWEHIAQQLARGIDYPNFKTAVSERRGPDLAHPYYEVWRVMHRVQSEASGKSSRSGAVDSEHHLG